MSSLFEPFALRGTVLKHRIIVPPMCTYASGPGSVATDWHLVHYGRLAMGGAAMIILEATAVDSVGLHSYADLGLWSDDHVPALRRLTDFMKSQDCVPAIQLQHAGRKASARRPWQGGGALDETDIDLRGEAPWQPVGPSPIPFAEGKPVPAELTLAQIGDIFGQWTAAARRALSAGFEVVEIHAAHGYLLNQFLSPVANHRTDRYGGSRENRMRLTIEVAAAVRSVWPSDKPVLVRVSAVDDVEGGCTLDDTISLVLKLKDVGVDAIDCSSGGIGGAATMSRLARTPGFQVPFSERIRREAGIPTIAVGLIMTPELAAEIVDTGAADLVAVGREVLANPNWPSEARTRLRPEDGYRHWYPLAGWWLERRAAILDSQPSNGSHVQTGDGHGRTA